MIRQSCPRFTDGELKTLEKYVREHTELLPRGYFSLRNNYNSFLARDLDEADKSFIEKCAEEGLIKLEHRKRWVFLGKRIDTARLTDQGSIVLLKEYAKGMKIT